MHRLAASVWVCLQAVSLVPAADVITTLAGAGPDVVDARSVSIRVTDLTVDAAGRILFTSQFEHRVFAVDAAGILTVVAGNGIEASLGDGGDVRDAGLLLPTCLAATPAGDLLICEGAEWNLTTEPPLGLARSSLRVRRVDAATSTIDRIVGTGALGFVPGPIAAVNAPLNTPMDLTLSPNGDLFLGQRWLDRFTFDELSIVHQVDAGTGALLHYAGNICCSGGYPYAGQPATEAFLYMPPVLAYRPGVGLLISDGIARRIWSVDPGTGLFGVFAGTGGAGDTGDGGPAVSATLTPGPLATDADGDVFSFAGARVRRVDATTGNISTVAGTGTAGFGGDGGAATSALLSTSGRIAADAAGNLFLGDSGGTRIRRVDAVTGLIDTVAGDPQEDYFGAGGPAVMSRMPRPVDVALLADRDLLVADARHTAIHRIDDVTGTFDTLLLSAAGGLQNGRPETLSGIAVSPQGDIYYLVRATYNGDLYDYDGANFVYRLNLSTGLGERVVGIGLPEGYDGDGGPALDALLYGPRAIAFDAAGNLFIADTRNNVIRRVDAGTQIITTYAGGGTPADGLGDGGNATAAALIAPIGIVLDPAGNLFIADTGHGRVRRVQSNNKHISTVAGDGVQQSDGDGGPATLASVMPRRLALDLQGNLYVSGDNRVRRVDAATGVITTVAGNGVFGFTGDGGPPDMAALADPEGIAVDGLGRIFIASGGSGRIRLVTPPLTTCPGAPCSNCPNGDRDDDSSDDACDGDDGQIFVEFTDASTLRYQFEIPWRAFNVYRGDLGVLRASGIYAQTSAQAPVAARFCRHAGGFVPDSFVPAAGQTVFYLVEGVGGNLGTNSAGQIRPNDNPCP